MRGMMLVMKKRYIMFIICIIVVILVIAIVTRFCGKNKDKNENININNTTETQDTNIVPEQKIEDIKEDLGYNSADTTIYEVKKEYDGREVLAIKPNIQYKVAMAGVIKNGKPEFSEIDDLLTQAPNKSGIWIEKNSRKVFLDNLKKYSNYVYSVDEEGYLVQEPNGNPNEVDENIKKAMNNKKNYSICIKSIAYLVDEVTGKIEEYPFEEIDPEQSFEVFETENASLYVITSNIQKKLDHKNIIDDVLNNMIV